MAGLTRLKQDIQFNHRLAGLLDALKAISAQQFYALERTFRANPVCREVIEAIAGTFDLRQLEHPLVRGQGPAAVVMVTSDMGLLGGLNQQVVALGLREYRESPGQLLVIGERGSAALREARVPHQAFASASDTDANRAKLAAELRDAGLNQVLSGKCARLSIVYPRALSFSAQRVEVWRALPCTEWARHETIARPVSAGPVILESTLSALVEYLAWMWLGQALREVLGMARLAELAARAVHLEGSAQELQRRAKKLWLQYFRERHELIDQDMRELFAARSMHRDEEDLAP